MSAVLAVLAGLLFALSASLQQRGTLAVGPDDDGGAQRVLPVVGLLRRLVRNRVWLTGWVTNLLGFATQAAALHLGSVTTVQPLLVTQLLFSLPLSALRTRQRPRLLDGLSAGSVCLGVGLFLSERDDRLLTGQPDRLRTLLGIGCCAVVVLALLLAARGRRSGLHAALTAVAAGMCFAVSAVLIKLTTDDLLHRGIAATAVDWPGYSLAVSTGLGLLIEQEAFRSGSLPTAIAGMSITNPVASFLLGVFALHEAFPHSPGALATFSASALLLALGVVGLAHSPTVRAEVSEAPDSADRSSATRDRSSERVSTPTCRP